MAGFSTRDSEVLERVINVELVPQCSTEQELYDKYEIDRCVQWIKDNCIENVCLQFPDSLLCDSVSVALILKKLIEKNPFILGDTSYGSCCVDEVAAEHANADGIIHFGHACLSPTVRLPVLYIFVKQPLNVESSLKDHLANIRPSEVLLIFDVEYWHHSDTIKRSVENHNVFISEPILSEEHRVPCSSNCRLLSGELKHSTVKLGRGYCLDNPSFIVFVGNKDSRTLHNLRISFQGTIHCCSEDGIEQIDLGKSLKRRWYLIEKVKDANAIGVIVGTLGVSGYLEAIKRVCTLVRRRKKKCYVISIGKPTVAKLANFPEIDVYVMITCSEAILENEKEFFQPIVSVMEVEMALNEARPWSEITTADFRDIIPGGQDFIDVPNEFSESGEPDISLISNKIRCTSDFEKTLNSSENATIEKRADMSVSTISSSLSTRTWQGLDPSVGETPVVKSVQGRSGIAYGYKEEGK